MRYLLELYRILENRTPYSRILLPELKGLSTSGIEYFGVSESFKVPNYCVGIEYFGVSKSLKKPNYYVRIDNLK